MTAPRLPLFHDELKAARKALIAAGWTHIMSAMDGDSKANRTDFGSLYTKGDRKFWLNWKTSGSVPRN